MGVLLEYRNPKAISLPFSLLESYKYDEFCSLFNVEKKQRCNTKSMVLFNSFSDDKILGLPKLKALAKDKSNVTQNINGVFHRIENTVGKEENASYQHFFFSHNVFKRLFPPVRQKSSLCDKGLNAAEILRFETSNMWQVPRVSEKTWQVVAIKHASRVINLPSCQL